MTETTKTILIVGGIAVVAYLAYKKITGKGVQPTTAGSGISGTTTNTQPQAGATTVGTSFWDTLGAVGKGLNSAISSGESVYNNVYDLFGGNTTTTTPGVGSPNQVAGSPG